MNEYFRKRLRRRANSSVQLGIFSNTSTSWHNVEDLWHNVEVSEKIPSSVQLGIFSATSTSWQCSGIREDSKLCPAWNLLGYVNFVTMLRYPRRFEALSSLESARIRQLRDIMLRIFGIMLRYPRRFQALSSLESSRIHLLRDIMLRIFGGIRSVLFLGACILLRVRGAFRATFLHARRVPLECVHGTLEDIQACSVTLVTW
jgi:hypothetical protein